MSDFAAFCSLAFAAPGSLPAHRPGRLPRHRGRMQTGQREVGCKEDRKLPAAGGARLRAGFGAL